MYTLTLTRNERKAIDFVGDRYGHGTDLFRMLCKGQWTPDVDWDSDEDIQFSLPEFVSWGIALIGEECKHRWDCFSPELAAKMNGFCNKLSKDKETHMSEYYVVQATVNGRQLPTFFLDPNVQGIRTGSDAIAVAKDIIGHKDDEVCIFIYFHRQIDWE